MIDGKKIIAVIPARGGSKGIPRKNIQLMAGKPLIAWTIEAAKASRSIDRVIVSTEDAEIADIGRQFGAEVPFIRPSEFASDTASGITPLLHALEECSGFDYAILLQPTSPLRTSQSIEDSLKFCVGKGATSLVSLTEVSIPPAHMFRSKPSGVIEPFQSHMLGKRRQDLEPLIALNGAIYIVNVPWFLAARRYIDEDTLGYLMPKNQSIDIDDPTDFLVAECLLAKR